MRAWARALRAGLGLLLAACATRAPAASPPAAQPAEPAASRGAEAAAARAAGLSRPPSPQERALIDRLMRETEEIRGLRFVAPVDVRIQDRAAMRAYVSRAIDEPDLARARRRYVALGLLDPDLDVRELVESLMEEELIGYYDPREKLLAVRDDVARSLGRPGGRETDLEWRATVVHELVHALQDQHLGLAQAMEVERTTDADDAFGALVEGEATLTMLGYAAREAGIPLEGVVSDPHALSASLHVTPERLTGALRSAPAVVREPLLFRYRDGALFSAQVLRRGGFAALDAAHRHPPDDTLSISEPDRYISHKQVPGLELFELAWLAAAGYEPVDQDVLGSFELGVALEHLGPSARALARAWRGDRYVVLAHGERDAAVWCLNFADGTSARRVEAGLVSRPDAEALTPTVVRKGTRVLFVRAVDAMVTRQIVERFELWAKR